MWPFGGRPRRDLPPVNYTESSSESGEEDFEAGLAFGSPLQSPQRPLPTREGSPQLLHHPTLNDNVDEDLEEVQWKLHDIASVRDDVEELAVCLEDADLKLGEEPPEVGEVVETTGVVKGEPGEADCEVPPDPLDNQEAAAADQIEAMVVNFDQEDKDDGEKVSRPGQEHQARIRSFRHQVLVRPAGGRDGNGFSGKTMAKKDSPPKKPTSETERRRQGIVNPSESGSW